MPSGAYGIAVDGLRGDPATAGLVEVDDDAPVVTIRREGFAAGAERPATRIGDDDAAVRLLPDGWLHVDRAAATATFHLPFDCSDAMLAHPYLAPIGGLWARWGGREAFHCGAVVLEGAAWAVLGAKEAGKSTTMVWLAEEGLPVLTDDLLVVDTGPAPRCHAGPRFVDLRAPTAEHLVDHGLPDLLVEVRDGERHRYPLAAVPPTAPLGGFLLLEEGDDTGITTVPPAERLPRLSEHRMVRLLPTDPVGLLDLVQLPVGVLRRPRDFGAMDGVVATLRDWARRNRPAFSDARRRP